MKENNDIIPRLEHLVYLQELSLFQTVFILLFH